MGILVLSVLGFILLFYAASIICDEYLVPAVEIFIVQFKIPEELAAVTFVALGNAAPELALDTLGALRSKSSISLSTTLGSAMIAFGLIPPLCVLLSTEKSFELSALPILREVCFYCFGLGSFLLVIADGYIQLYEAILLSSIYIVYVSSVMVLYYTSLISTNAAAAAAAAAAPLSQEDEDIGKGLLADDAELGREEDEDEDGKEEGVSDKIIAESSTQTKDCPQRLSMYFRRSWRCMCFPVRCLIVSLMPRLKPAGASAKVRVSLIRAIGVLVLSIVLVGNLSSGVISICGIIIEELKVDASTLGATLVALGAQIPDTLSAIALARKGAKWICFIFFHTYFKYIEKVIKMELWQEPLEVKWSTSVSVLVFPQF